VGVGVRRDPGARIKVAVRIRPLLDWEEKGNHQATQLFVNEEKAQV
jgi:hypothetical protein